MKINFIPEKYIEMNNKKSIKNYIILIIILVTINSIYFNNLLYNMKKIDCIKEEIHNLNVQSCKLDANNPKNDENYNLFKNVYENMNNGIILDNFNIKEGRVTLEGKCVDLDSYYSLLNSLEKNKKINIKNLDLPKKEEDFYEFKFILE